MVYEGMLGYVLKVGSLTGIGIQNLSDQIFSGIGDWHILGKVIGIHPDPLVRSLDVTGLEGRLSNDQGVNDDTQ